MYPALANQASRRFAQLTLALAKDDASAARQLFEEMERAGLLDGGPIRARWRRVARIRIHQIEGTDADIRGCELQDLIDGARQGAAIGGVCDAEAAAVCYVYLRAGDAAKAGEFLDEFTRELRRTRAPLARCLVEVRRAISTTRERDDWVSPVYAPRTAFASLTRIGRAGV